MSTNTTSEQAKPKPCTIEDVKVSLTFYQISDVNEDGEPTGELEMVQELDERPYWTCNGHLCGLEFRSWDEVKEHLAEEAK